MTSIEWVRNADGSQGKTWNPTVGCSLVSPGCTNCYAMKTARRFDGMGRGYDGTTQPSKGGPVWTGKVNLLPNRLSIPLKRKKPTVWFVNSMSDLFHESIPFEFIAAVFGVMAACPQHTFQLLTKLPERAAKFFEWLDGEGGKLHGYLAEKLGEATGWADWDPDDELGEECCSNGDDVAQGLAPWIWLGTSVEDQQRADDRIPELLRCPAAVRFLSVEPLLGPVDLASWLDPVEAPEIVISGIATGELEMQPGQPMLDWVIVGGESGPGARPMHPDWARSARDQCQAAGVPYFFKQWGSWRAETVEGTDVDLERDLAPNQAVAWGDGKTNHTRYTNVGKKAAGRLLDGRTWDEMPGQEREAVAS